MYSAVLQHCSLLDCSTVVCCIAALLHVCSLHAVLQHCGLLYCALLCSRSWPCPGAEPYFLVNVREESGSLELVSRYPSTRQAACMPSMPTTAHARERQGRRADPLLLMLLSSCVLLVASCGFCVTREKQIYIDFGIFGPSKRACTSHEKSCTRALERSYFRGKCFLFFFGMHSGENTINTIFGVFGLSVGTCISHGKTAR